MVAIDCHERRLRDFKKHPYRGLTLGGSLQFFQFRFKHRGKPFWHIRELRSTEQLANCPHDPRNISESANFNHEHIHPKRIKPRNIRWSCSSLPRQHQIRLQRQQRFKRYACCVGYLWFEFRRFGEIAIGGDANQLFVRACRVHQLSQ